MGMPDKGYFFWEPSPVLATVIVTEEPPDEAPWEGTKVTTLYQPTEDEIRQLCVENRFDVDETLKLIRGKDPAIHSLFIDAKKYRNG